MNFFENGEGMAHDPIHVIPKIDPIVPDKGAVIQGQTDPNRDVEININGKWTDSVQSDDKGIFRFPPKDLNFNDSVYIEVIPKEVSGKYLEGRTIYLTMDRSSAQYKDQFLKHAQEFTVEELVKYPPTGWTIKVIKTKNGDKIVHIKNPELVKHIEDIFNSKDEMLKDQLTKIKQRGKGYRIRIDQADGVTTYQHIHKYNDEGLLMNEEGEAVDYKSPDGHIPYNHEIPEPSVIEDIIEASKSEATKGKWLTEGTAKKFLSTNGTFFVGLHKLDGKYYYFDPENGGLLTGNITTDKGKKLVADPDTGIIDFDMAMKIDDKYYLVNPLDLSNKTGFQKTTINGVSGYYYFDDKTGAMTSEDKTINGDKYYFEKETGRVKTGWIETDTGKKYLDENGLSYFKRFHFIKGGIYIFDDNGNLLIGKIQQLAEDGSYRKVSEYNSKDISIPGSILRNSYLFADSDGKLVTEKEFSVDNKYYYAGIGGRLQTGYVYMDYLDNNKIAYFDDVTFAKVTNSTYHIRVLPEIFPDDLFHTRDILSGKDGFLISGLQQIFSNGKLITVYYSPKSKRMLHGEYDIDGQHYSFDRKTGALATGLHVFDGKTYYVKPEGSLAMNEEQHINDSYYFFDKDGVMQTGFVDLTPNGQNKKVYYGSDGKMLYGQQKIGDDYYLFEHGTGKMLTGFQNLKDYGQDKVSYFDPKTGAMVHDQIVVDGIKYKLDNASGWHNGGVISGWTDDGTDKYYVGDDGKLMHGQQRVGNDIYLFSNDTGALQTGFQDLKDYGQDKICYFDPKTGAMVHDQVTVDGITYKLDDAASWHNGGLVSGVANVDLTKYFTKNPGQVVIKNDDFIYSTTLFTDKVKAVKAGDIVNVQAIEYSPNGYPRLKVEGGYLTANRSYVEKAATPSRPNITVQAFVQNDGWQSPVQENQIAGTVEQGKRLEAFKVKITNMQDTYQGDAIYQAHVAGIGWQSEVKNDELAGTIDQARQVEAVKMHLTGELADKYDLYYRVQVQNYGWLDWASNNEVAGTTGMGLRVEAIEFALNPKGQQFTGNTTRPSIEK